MNAVENSENAREGTPSARTGVDLTVAVPLAIVHALALGLAPVTYSPAGLVALVLGYLFTGFGVTGGAHRLFTHRSFTPTPLVRDLFALAFLLSAQGSIERWVRDHGIHHRYSDRPGDPHSPVNEGFFAAHVGWLWRKPPTREEARGLYARYTRGLDAGRVGRFFRAGGRLAALHVSAVLAAYLAGACVERGFHLDAPLTGFRTGLSVVVWGVFLRIVLVMHSTFFVNSATHLWGYRRHPARDDSRNLWWVGVVALGEGWHNNHHARPSAANNGFHAWWEFDLTFVLLVALGALGLVSDVKVWDPKVERTRVWFARDAATATLEPAE